MKSNFLSVKRACARLTRVASIEAQARIGVYGAQAQALLTLAQMGECQISELGDLMGLGKSAMTTLVGRMVKENLISRSTSKNDARVQLVRLTTSGWASCRSVEKMIADFDAVLLGGFTAKEVEVIECYLERMSKLERL